MTDNVQFHTVLPKKDKDIFARICAEQGFRIGQAIRYMVKQSTKEKKILGTVRQQKSVSQGSPLDAKVLLEAKAMDKFLDSRSVNAYLDQEKNQITLIKRVSALSHAILQRHYNRFWNLSHNLLLKITMICVQINWNCSNSKELLKETYISLSGDANQLTKDLNKCKAEMRLYNYDKFLANKLTKYYGMLKSLIGSSTLKTITNFVKKSICNELLTVFHYKALKPDLVHAKEHPLAEMYNMKLDSRTRQTRALELLTRCLNLIFPDSEALDPFWRIHARKFLSVYIAELMFNKLTIARYTYWQNAPFVGAEKHQFGAERNNEVFLLDTIRSMIESHSTVWFQSIGNIILNLGAIHTNAGLQDAPFSHKVFSNSNELDRLTVSTLRSVRDYTLFMLNQYLDNVLRPVYNYGTKYYVYTNWKKVKRLAKKVAKSFD